MNIPLDIIDKAIIAGEGDPRAYVQKVFGFLERMEPETSFKVTDMAKIASKDLFVDVVKFYIKSHEWQGDITFSEDMSSIKKTNYN